MDQLKIKIEREREREKWYLQVLLLVEKHDSVSFPVLFPFLKEHLPKSFSSPSICPQETRFNFHLPSMEHYFSTLLYYSCSEKRMTN